jgi:hypothetical protein
MFFECLVKDFFKSQKIYTQLLIVKIIYSKFFKNFKFLSSVNLSSVYSVDKCIEVKHITANLFLRSGNTDFL